MKSPVFNKYRILTSFAMTIVLLVTCSVSVFASTGVYLGSGNIYYGGGDMNYDVRGYVYYNSNTSSAINLSSLVQWVFNYGVYEINEVHFEAFDANYNKYTHNWGYLDNGIKTGKNSRIEADWDSICLARGYNTVYSKNSSQSFAYTDLYSGYSYAGLGGWGTFWFPSSRSSSFHY